MPTVLGVPVTVTAPTSPRRGPPVGSAALAPDTAASAGPARARRGPRRGGSGPGDRPGDISGDRPEDLFGLTSLQLLRHLDTGPRGLTEAQAGERLVRHG